MSARHHHTPQTWHRPTVTMLRGALLAAVKVPPPGGIPQWVADNKVVVASTSNRMFAGQPYDFTRFPVISRWMFEFATRPTSEVLFTDGTVRTVRNRVGIIMKDSQSAASESAIFVVGFVLEYRPGNVIMVTDTREQIRSFATDRVEPILKQFPALRSAKDESATTSLAWRYDGGTLYLGGSQSAGAFISKPASLCIADEVAKHALVNGMSTIALLEGRGTGDDEFKLLAFSTPDNACEYAKNPITGKQELIVTAETVIHAEYKSGTCERVECPCPHCGHWQPFQMERLRFDHCKESLPDESGAMGKPYWNKERVLREAWYQCVNPDCTDRHPDGKVRGRIDEEAKRAMVQIHRTVGTNLQYQPGRRSLQLGAFVNVAFASRSLGAIACAFLTARERGGESAMKAFYTEVLGVPFQRYQVREDALLAVKALCRGYRRLHYDTAAGATRKIPLATKDCRFVGMTVDVQQDCVKWYVFAAAWDGQTYALDWGRVPELDDLTAIIETRQFSTRDDDTERWEIVLVYVDTQYRKKHVYRFLSLMGGTTRLPRWEGIAGRDQINSREARILPHWVKEYPVEDEHGRATDCLVRVHNLDADYWEAELHIERISKPYAHAKDSTSPRPTKPAVNLPGDTPDDFLAEVANAEQYWTKPDRKHALRELIWRKVHSDRPNDRADNLRMSLVMVDAVDEEERR